MEKIFLLPNGFKKVGWIILVPTFVLGVLMTIDGYNGFPSFLLPEWIPLAMKRVLTSDWVGKILNNVAIIGICLGCLFVISSFSLVFVNDNFFCFTVLNYSSGNTGIFHIFTSF